MKVLAVVTYPFRVAFALGEVTLALARLMEPDGPIQVLYQLAAMMSEDRPLGRAIGPGGGVDRAFDENGLAARLTAVGGPLDRLMEEGVVEKLNELVAACISGLLVIERLEPVILRLAPVLERVEPHIALVVPVLEQAEPSVAQLAPAIAQIAPVIEQLAPLLDGLAPVVDVLEPVLRRVDESSQTLSSVVDPIFDLGRRVPVVGRRFDRRV
jgi:hypothetical protein